MKITLLTIMIIVGVILAGILGAYAIAGFFSWVFNDPFDWIQDSPIYQEPKDFQLCREKGGVPIKSGWSGLLKRCDLIN